MPRELGAGKKPQNITRIKRRRSMSKRNAAIVAMVLVGLCAAFNMSVAQRAPQPSTVPAAKPAPTPAPTEADSALIKQYCVGCHGDSAPKAGLSLTKFDLAHPEQRPEIAERLIKKLRAGMMPPPGSRRPEAAA